MEVKLNEGKKARILRLMREVGELMIDLHTDGVVDELATSVLLRDDGQIVLLGEHTVVVIAPPMYDDRIAE